MFFKVARQGKNDLGSYLATFFLVIIAFILGQLPIGVVMMMQTQSNDFDSEVLAEFERTLDFTLIGLDANLAFILFLISFILALAALLLFVRVIHRKPTLSIFTSRTRLDWGRVLWAFSIWFGVTSLFEVVSYFLDPDNYIFQFQPGKFFILLGIALFLLPLQTSFEELFFRGYLLQGLGLATGSKWIPLLITSVAFGALHVANPEVGEFGLGVMMSYYIGFGLFMGICTIMDDGLEIALGLHAATNIYGATMVTFTGSALQTPALFKALEINVDGMVVFTYVVMILFLLLAARKYNWGSFKKLIEPIEKEQSAEDMVLGETPTE